MLHIYVYIIYIYIYICVCVYTYSDIDSENEVVKDSLDFASKINDPEIRRDFKIFVTHEMK